MHGGGAGSGGGSTGTVRVGAVPLQALSTSGANRLIIVTKPCILFKSATVAQQMQALQPKLPNNNNNNCNIANNNKLATDSKPELLRCKRRTELSTKLGLPKAQPASVARRNARERNRVKQVNLGFDTLRDHVPNGRKNKKLSKVDTLRSAVEYIKYLTDILHPDGQPMPPLSSHSVTFAPGEFADSCSPNEEDHGLSDSESTMLTDSDTPGADENRCFPSPSLGDATSPFAADVSEDVKPLSQDEENRDPIPESRVPSLDHEQLKHFGSAEQLRHFGGDEMSQVNDVAFQEFDMMPSKQDLTDLTRLDASDLVQMVSVGHHPSIPAFSLPETSTGSAGLNSPVLTPLQNSPFISMSFPLPQNPSSHPYILASYPHLPFTHLGKMPLSRHSLSDAETNSSLMSPASSVETSDQSSEALGSLTGDDIDITTLLRDFCAESSAFTTGEDMFQSIPADCR